MYRSRSICGPEKRVQNRGQVILLSFEGKHTLARTMLEFQSLNSSPFTFLTSAMSPRIMVQRPLNLDVPVAAWVVQERERHWWPDESLYGPYERTFRPREIASAVTGHLKYQHFQLYLTYSLPMGHQRLIQGKEVHIKRHGPRLPTEASPFIGNKSS